MAFGPKPDPDKEPDRVVEYIDRPDEGTDAELARASVRAAYFEALAKPEAEGVRLAALQQFLLDHPEAEQAAEAAAAEHELSGSDEHIEYEDEDGVWHEEDVSGEERPETDVER